MVPSPGVTPRAASAATRSFRSALTAAAVALPSRIDALTLTVPSRLLTVLSAGLARPGLVVEVPDAGEVQRHAGRLRGRDHAVIPDGAARLDHRADSRLREYLETVGEREER